MDFKQLEAFVAVVREGSFSKAGEKLFLTQPTISAHIKNLETELNVKLVNRTTKTAMATQQGKQLFTYATAMLELRENAVLHITPKKNDANAIIRIAASSVPSQYILPNVISAFCAQNPGVSFKIINTDSCLVSTCVLENEAELGVAGTKLEINELTYTQFATDELVLLAKNTQQMQALAKRGVTDKDLLSLGFIKRKAQSGTRREFEQFLHSVGITDTKIKTVAELEDTESIKRMVANGVGVSVVSARAAQDYCERGLTLVLPMQTKTIIRNFYTVKRKNAPISAACKKFEEYLLNSSF